MNTSPPPDLSSLDQAALDWFVRRQGGLTAQGQADFEAWRSESPANAQAFARWEQDWSALDALPATDIAALTSRLAQHDTRARSLPRPPWWQRWAPPYSPRMPRTRLAAALLVLCASGLAGWHHWQSQPTFVQQVTTERGQQRDLGLPDGSLVRLDTATQARITLYRQRREVRLPEGQAVFKVKGDVARPFEVLAGPWRITAVGTRFSVRYTPSLSANEPVTVAVEEGHVRVSRADEDPDKAVADLVAGQQVSSTAQGDAGEVSTVPMGGIASWQNHRVSFGEVTLARALAEFERYGPTHLTVSDPAVARLRITGTFDPRRLDNFARVLPQVLPVRLRTQEAGITDIVAAN